MQRPTRSRRSLRSRRSGPRCTTSSRTRPTCASRSSDTSSPPETEGDQMRTTTVIIGGGQAGLAMSRRLSDRSIDHVVLERAEVANTWRTERWDSLRLLTPNWQCRLPGHAYAGDDPDGFMTMSEVVELIAGYAKAIAAPVQAGTTVTSVRGDGDG